MDDKSRSSTIQERTRSCSSEERRSCPSTKYGFPRRSMPAARFRQWHFNRRARNSCLHLHRVVSSFRLFFSPVSLRGHPDPMRLAALLCGFTCRAANAHVARGVAADARGIALALIPTYRTAGVHVFPHTYERINLTGVDYF